MVLSERSLCEIPQAQRKLKLSFSARRQYNESSDNGLEVAAGGGGWGWGSNHGWVSYNSPITCLR